MYISYYPFNASIPSLAQAVGKSRNHCGNRRDVCALVPAASLRTSTATTHAAPKHCRNAWPHDRLDTIVWPGGMPYKCGFLLLVPSHESALSEPGTGSSTSALGASASKSGMISSAPWAFFMSAVTMLCEASFLMPSQYCADQAVIVRFSRFTFLFLCRIEL